jgi:hypothetical protein
MISIRPLVENTKAKVDFGFWKGDQKTGLKVRVGNFYNLNSCGKEK